VVEPIPIVPAKAVATEIVFQLINPESATEASMTEKYAILPCNNASLIPKSPPNCRYKVLKFCYLYDIIIQNQYHRRVEYGR